MKHRPHASSGWLTMLLLALFVLPATGCASSADTADTNLAIRGYDPVAYFRAGKAQKGNDAYTYTWHNMTWQFASPENRALFQADPARYAPQYDGYCAWAMTESRLAKTDPEVWNIVDGKLYLNCSQAAYEKWSRDIPGHIEQADKNWAKLYK